MKISLSDNTKCITGYLGTTAADAAAAAADDATAAAADAAADAAAAAAARQVQRKVARWTILYILKIIFIGLKYEDWYVSHSYTAE